MVSTSSWWELPFPHPRHPPLLPPWLPGGVSPSAYEIWLETSAQMLQPWLPSSPAALGSGSIQGCFSVPFAGHPGTARLWPCPPLRAPAGQLHHLAEHGGALGEECDRVGLWLKHRNMRLATLNLISTSPLSRGASCPRAIGVHELLQEAARPHPRTWWVSRACAGSPYFSPGLGMSLFPTLFLALEIHVCAPSPHPAMLIILHSAFTGLLTPL